MAGKGENHGRGLAERSVNTSIVQPSQGGPDIQEQSDRTLPRNEQREALEKTTPDRTTADDRDKR